MAPGATSEQHKATMRPDCRAHACASTADGKQQSRKKRSASAATESPRPCAYSSVLMSAHRAARPALPQYCREAPPSNAGVAAVAAAETGCAAMMTCARGRGVFPRRSGSGTVASLETHEFALLQDCGPHRVLHDRHWGHMMIPGRLLPSYPRPVGATAMAARLQHVG